MPLFPQITSAYPYNNALLVFVVGVFEARDKKLAGALDKGRTKLPLPTSISPLIAFAASLSLVQLPFCEIDPSALSWPLMQVDFGSFTTHHKSNGAPGLSC